MLSSGDVLIRDNVPLHIAALNNFKHPVWHSMPDLTLSDYYLIQLNEDLQGAMETSTCGLNIEVPICWLQHAAMKRVLHNSSTDKTNVSVFPMIMMKSNFDCIKKKPYYIANVAIFGSVLLHSFGKLLFHMYKNHFIFTIFYLVGG